MISIHLHPPAAWFVLGGWAPNLLSLWTVLSGSRRSGPNPVLLCVYSWPTFAWIMAAIGAIALPFCCQWIPAWFPHKVRQIPCFPCYKKVASDWTCWGIAFFVHLSNKDFHYWILLCSSLLYSIWRIASLEPIILAPQKCTPSTVILRDRSSVDYFLFGLGALLSPGELLKHVQFMTVWYKFLLHSGVGWQPI